ncbi:MAG: hypothetical protein WCP12_01040 [bacterium]
MICIRDITSNKNWILSGVIFVCFFLLYAATAQRGVSWQDSGEFQYRVLAHDYFWISGIARSHPCYIAGAELFSFFFPASCRFYALNLFSGLGMSLALFFLTRILLQLQLKTSTIILAVLTLGLTHMAWWMSTIAEVYTWSLAFLMAELLCVAHLCATPEQDSGVRVQGWILLALLNGLHASLHNFAFLNLPIYAILFVYLHARKHFLYMARVLLICASTWLLGACLLLGLFVIEWGTTQSFVTTVKSLLFGREFEDVVVGTRAINWPLAKMNLALAGISLFNPAWVFAGFAGRTHSKYTCFKIVLLGLTAIHVVFWIRYFVPDQATFILPSLALLVIWVGMGLDSLTLQRKHLITLGAVILFFSLATPLILHHFLQTRQGGVKRMRELPFREESSYWLFPWKHNEQSAARFIQHVCAILKQGDVLIADNTAAGPIMAAQAAGLLTPHIRVITFFTGETDEDLVRLIKTRARVFIVSPVAGYTSNVLLTGHFTFEKEDVLYRIRSAHHE